MKTKLVLSVCALAAITGAAPRVFGMFEQLPPTERTWADLILSTDSRRQIAFDEDLDNTKQILEADTARLAKMGDMEVFYVKTALSDWRRAHLICGLDVHNLNSAELKVDSIRKDLLIAQESVRLGGGWFFDKKKAQEKVKRLEAELATAEKCKEYILKIVSMNNVDVERHIESSLKFRKKAYELRLKRLAFLNKLNDADIKERGEKGQEEDLAKVEQTQDICALEKLRVSGIRDGLFVQEDSRRHRNEVMINEAIMSAIWHHTHDWAVGCIDDRDRDNYRDLHDKLLLLYQQYKLGYDCQSIQKPRLIYSGFGKCYQLESAANMALLQRTQS
jgi:hypothetical protein